jgi:hypothetical protein
MPEGKRPLGRSRHRWEDVRMYLKQVGWNGVDWIYLAQDGDWWRASGPIKGGEFLD